MIQDLMLKVYPFWCFPSTPFCEIEVGELFKDKKHVYRLLKRDPWKVRVVHWNWWTRLWWGGDLNEYRRKVTN